MKFDEINVNKMEQQRYDDIKKKCKYVISKYEEYNYYSSDSIMCKQVYLIDYNLNLTSNNIYTYVICEKDISDDNTRIDYYIYS